MLTYHVVTSQGNVILGVFGEKILSAAQECARQVERETGFDAYVRQVQVIDYKHKPYVGQILEV